MKAYLDSSSFAKRFIEEPGSNKVEAICSEASDLGLSVLCVPEIISALNRRKREHILTQAQYNAAKRRLIKDVRDADIINLTTSVVGSSIAILETSPIRTLDAIHIACALEWEAELFVSSGKRQLNAAKQAGLKTKKA
ncbi:type II toxin-antitoxin system VapC family toxin [Verrucomicrobiota bacterium]